ncbi:MAG: hypothetical protein MUO31_06765 [Thermodesulfovibrionales bacterium]|nr:hypothetical protein [Thermodesulfovibrionales bacterium]
MACLLNISMAACNTNAIAIAGEWIAYGKSGSTADDWNEFARGNYGTTANGKIDMSAGINSGEISCSMGDTTGIATRGQRVLIYDTSTAANSMVNMLVDVSTGVALYFCFSSSKDFSTHCDVLCPTGATLHGVNQWPVRVPEEYWTARVVFLNDDADVNYLCRVQYNFITDYTSV